MKIRDGLVHSLVRRAATVLAGTLAVALPAALSASGETVPLNAFSVPPGATVTITFEVDVDDPLGLCASSISNQGSISGTNLTTFLTDDPGVVGGSDPTVTPLDAIDLAITKTDGAATAVPGTSVAYTIVASNGGPNGAVGVTVADSFPASLSGCSTTSVAAGGATGNDPGPTVGNLNDTGIALPSGASVTYTATCTIAANASGTLVNTATIAQSGTQLECNVANNSATDSDNLTPQADVSITKDDGVTEVDAGASTTYTIVASNAGPSDAAGVTVSDTFPAAITSCTTTSVAAGGATGNDPGPTAGNLNDGGITLPVGAAVTYTAICSVSGSATGSLVNTATISTSAADPNGGNNSATDTDTINPIADLSITKSDGTTTAVAGLQTTYTIVAANAGPATATGAAVSDTFPATLTCTWTCVGAGGGTCTAGPVAGNIADGVNLPATATATYTAICDIADTATGTITNTATISGGGVSDTNPGNNSATDTDTLLPLDYGDAPHAVLGPPWAYPTLLADGGARHAVDGALALRLGVQLDTEADGQPTLAADGDDQIAGPDVDDEDGVALPAALVACESANVTVTASNVAKLDAFVDFDRNGSFADPGEQIFSSQNLVAGANPLAFTVPCSATPTGQTFARFRVSTAGGLAASGVAADGEVEDYPVVVRGLDFGDAPATYPTLFAGSGARHVVTGAGPVLASAPDTEVDGQPTVGATGDDLAGSDDEDGVAFTTPLARGQNANVTVTASAAGVLNAWIDFNGDGNWTTPGDQIFTDQVLAVGANNLTFAVPASATTNLATYSRFRVATAAGLAATGLAADGEVEDHAVATAAEADLAITKTDGATTEVPGTTVVYTIVASNAGPDAAGGVTVADTFPAILSGCSTTSVGAGGATGNEAGPLAGDLNDTGITLPAGGSVTFVSTCTISAAATGSLTNTATVAAAIGDPVAGNNSATDTDTLTPETDLAITKTDGSATEVPGTAVTYTIVASNAGPSNAVGATVADAFPAILSGCSTTSVAAGGATGNEVGPVAGNLNDTGVDLPVGASVTYTATCTVAAAATGTLVNTATAAIGAGATDPVPGNNSATDTDTLTPETDLAVTKTDGSATEVPGTAVTYTIVASNAGPSNAVGATVADTFPATITGVTWSCVGAGGGVCPANGAGNLNAAVDLPVGAAATFTATGTIASSATGTLVNTVTVTAGGGATDPSAGNNGATDSDTLTPQADLAITKDDSADPPPAGQDLVYTLTVENLGPSDATGVQVSDPLPAAVTYVSDTCGGTNTPPWSWTIGALASGATATCDVTVSINPAPPISISNTATVAATTTDPVPGNDSDTEVTQLDAIPPEVDTVGSIADSGDGVLEECETATVAIGRLEVRFSEAMADPPGDGGAADVTNPANYLLVTPGADFDFATTACGGAGGDDEALAIVAVTYDSGSDTATLDLGGVLAGAQYRLFACDSLTDLAGNALDGDGDTTAGGDFSRSFRSDPGNLFANGHFDCDAAGWTATAAAPGEVTWTGSEDADGADDSGAVAVTNLAPGVDTSFGLDQCYPVPSLPAFDLACRMRLDAAPGVLIGFVRACEFFSSAGCGGSLGTQTNVVALGDTGGAWLTLSTPLTAPAGAVSARCAFTFQTPAAAAFDGFVDAAFFGGSGLIFADDFETGDLLRWSGVAP